MAKQKAWRLSFPQTDTMRDNSQFLLHAHIKQFTAWVNT